jgi:hypothetical protein
MPADEALSEKVVLELRGRSGAERPWERLRPRWFGGTHTRGDAALAAVQLRPEEGDLAVLPRTAEPSFRAAAA